MALKTLPSRELLHQLLHYDMPTGEFTWRPRPREMFTSNSAFKHGTAAMPETIAGMNSGGYSVPLHCCQSQSISGRTGLYGSMSTANRSPIAVDHIDGNPCEQPLRQSAGRNKGQNPANMRCEATPKKSASKASCIDGRLYVPTSCFSGKDIHFGYFQDDRGSWQAHIDAAVRLHGEFASWD